MHEIAMVEDVFRIMMRVAAENNISRIDRVDIVIGEYLQVKHSLFEFAFESAREGTIASSACLILETRMVELRCTGCRQLFLLKGLKYSCPCCGSGALEITDGKDMYIKSIEGE
jgi:hydrogenase nickel incorporation protein HypA/HybF